MNFKGRYSKHKVGGHTSDVNTPPITSHTKLIEKAADILNSGEKVVILVG
jgi:pyruvate dehydrogenase (quinone)/pyruvate oxidase